MTTATTEAPRPRSATPHARARAALTRPHVDLEVVVPALNEEGRLPETLEATLEYLGRQPWSSAVVVVDNGSVDGTTDVVRGFMGGRVPVHLVGCALPGKGAAVRRGFSTGTSTYVGFMDADLATPVETLDRVMPLLRNGTTAVIGSRSVAEARRVVPQGLVRRVGGEVFRATARTVLPEIADSQCGFKFFSGGVVRDVLRQCTVDGFSFDLELLARLWRDGHPVLEVPVVWTDKAGSSFNPVRHGVRSFTDTVRIRRLVSAAGPVTERVVDLRSRTAAERR